MDLGVCKKMWSFSLKNYFLFINIKVNFIIFEKLHKNLQVQ